MVIAQPGARRASLDDILSASRKISRRGSTRQCCDIRLAARRTSFSSSTNSNSTGNAIRYLMLRSYVMIQRRD